MNQADKAEALRLIDKIEQVHGIFISPLRALIERQPDDTDGEMWRFCVERKRFPVSVTNADWSVGWSMSDRWPFAGNDTPAEAVQAAMAAMKEKA